MNTNTHCTEDALHTMVQRLLDEAEPTAWDQDDQVERYSLTLTAQEMATLSVLLTQVPQDTQRRTTMRTTRIELDGRAGHVAIERKAGEATIRIDSIIRDPVRGQQAWKSWELPAAISDQDLFKVAIEVQFRTDGGTGTNSEITDYFREMQRFQD